MIVAVAVEGVEEASVVNVEEASVATVEAIAVIAVIGEGEEEETLIADHRVETRDPHHRECS